jgi:hypothetical protein
MMTKIEALCLAGDVVEHAMQTEWCQPLKGEILEQFVQMEKQVRLVEAFQVGLAKKLDWDWADEDMPKEVLEFLNALVKESK